MTIEPCCALKYYPEIEQVGIAGDLKTLQQFLKQAVKEKKGEEESKAKEAARQADENFGKSKLGKFRTFVWNLMEYPETSRAAQVSNITFWPNSFRFRVFVMLKNGYFFRYLPGALLEWC